YKWFVGQSDVTPLMATVKAGYPPEFKEAASRWNNTPYREKKVMLTIVNAMFKKKISNLFLLSAFLCTSYLSYIFICDYVLVARVKAAVTNHISPDSAESYVGKAASLSTLEPNHRMLLNQLNIQVVELEQNKTTVLSRAKEVIYWIRPLKPI